MAIAVLGSPVSASGANVSSRALTYSLPAGSNRLLLFMVSIGCDPPNAPTAISWGGVAATPYGDANEGVFTRALLYYLLEADLAGASGTTGSVTLLEASDCGFAVQAFSGVHQTIPFGTVANASGASGTTASAAPGSAVGDLVVAALCSDDEGGPSIVSGTSIYQVNGIDGDTSVAAGYWTGASPTVTAAWTQVSNRWAVSAGSLKPAAGGGRTTKNTRGYPLGMEIGMGWRMDIGS